MFRRTIAAALTASAALALTLIPTPAHAAVANSFCSGTGIPGNPGVQVRAWYSGETPVKVDAVEVSETGDWQRIEKLVIRPSLREWSGALAYDLADRVLYAGWIVWDPAGTWNIPGIRGRVRVDLVWHRNSGDTVTETCVALLNP